MCFCVGHWPGTWALLQAAQGDGGQTSVVGEGDGGVVGVFIQPLLRAGK